MSDIRTAVRNLCFCICVFMFSVGVNAQEEPDPPQPEEPNSIQEEPRAEDEVQFQDIIEPAEDTSETLLDVNALFSSPEPKLKGSVKVSGGIGIGWHQLSKPEDFVDSYDGNFYYDLDVSMNFDFRPDSVFRWAGDISSGIAAGSFSWSTPKINSMYVNYTLLDAIFFTIGKFSATWGQGRIFNVGNLVSGIGDGLAFSSFFPLGPLSNTFIVMARPSFFEDSSNPQAKEIGLAGAIESSIGPLNFGIAGFYQERSVPTASVYLKTAALGFDLFTEARLDINSAEDNVENAVALMAGFFWEGLDPKLRIQVEYLFDSTDNSLLDHNVGIAATLSTIPGTGIKVSAKWQHAFLDGSGQIIVGFEGDPLPHIHLSIGVPFTYGEVGSRYYNDNPDPAKRALVIGLKLDISAQF